MARKQQSSLFYLYRNALRVGKLKALINSLNKNHKEVTMEEMETILKECENIISALNKERLILVSDAKAMKKASVKRTEEKLFQKDNDLDA
ncbi:MAG: hypothetical protein U9Q18_03230 [Caldisericota bacterium]|nr:hypothetical protein [Caldisericota bacterium]